MKIYCTSQDNSAIADTTQSTESEDTKTIQEDIRGLRDDFIALVVEFGSTKRQLEESERNYQVNAKRLICAE